MVRAGRQDPGGDDGGDDGQSCQVVETQSTAGIDSPRRSRRRFKSWLMTSVERPTEIEPMSGDPSRRNPLKP